MVQVTIDDKVRTELAGSLGLSPGVVAGQVGLSPEAAAAACGEKAAEPARETCAAVKATDELRAAVLGAIEAGGKE